MIARNPDAESRLAGQALLERLTSGPRLTPDRIDAMADRCGASPEASLCRNVWIRGAGPLTTSTLGSSRAYCVSAVRRSETARATQPWLTSTPGDNGRQV
ncbi:hypothetical protein GCM10023195_70340 [Actinoallomurus liliacearum]|uniref:Uncharacterized protein n=1 Tax=Actinoallomurus liliacearum TaxID=1080073 RepID=A0ABP8TTL4_9ACTN